MYRLGPCFFIIFVELQDLVDLIGKIDGSVASHMDPLLFGWKDPTGNGWLRKSWLYGAQIHLYCLQCGIWGGSPLSRTHYYPIFILISFMSRGRLIAIAGSTVVRAQPSFSTNYWASFMNSATSLVQRLSLLNLHSELLFFSLLFLFSCTYSSSSLGSEAAQLIRLVQAPNKNTANNDSLSYD